MTTAQLIVAQVKSQLDYTMINKNIFTLNLEERIINDVVTECIEML